MAVQVRKFGVRSEAAKGTAYRATKTKEPVLTLSVRLEPGMFHHLKARAMLHNVCMATVIRDALSRHLNVGN